MSNRTVSFSVCKNTTHAKFKEKYAGTGIRTNIFKLRTTLVVPCLNVLSNKLILVMNCTVNNIRHSQQRASDTPRNINDV